MVTITAVTTIGILNPICAASAFDLTCPKVHIPSKATPTPNIANNLANQFNPKPFFI